MCKGVKAIGWYIDEYEIAQISMNITDVNATPLHEAFEACRQSANNRGLRVTGSELVGLVPLKVLTEAGKYFLTQQQRSHGIAERELVHIAVKSLGLDELGPFDPNKKIIEYQLQDKEKKPLINMKLDAFADETASEKPAPGGGSIAAYVGALGASLGTMVANLSAHKRGWDSKWDYYSDWAVQGQEIKDTLIDLVDEDTHAFTQFMNAIRMPKGNEEEKAARKKAMEDATRNAINVPLEVMRTAYKAYDMLDAMAESGLKASISDAGVGALCTKAAIEGAFMNVKINLDGLNDRGFLEKVMEEAQAIQEKSVSRSQSIVDAVEEVIKVN